MDHKRAGRLDNPCCSWGYPTLHCAGQNHSQPTNRPASSMTPTACGLRSGSQRATKMELTHKWANWLHNPYRLGGPQRSRGGDKIRSGPQIGRAATCLAPARGSPTLQSGEPNPKWSTTAMGIVTQRAIRLHTSDFYGPSPPTPNTQPPHDRPPPPQYQTSGQVENGKIWNLGKRSTWGKA